MEEIVHDRLLGKYVDYIIGLPAGTSSGGASGAKPASANSKAIARPAKAAMIAPSPSPAPSTPKEREAIQPQLHVMSFALTIPSAAPMASTHSSNAASVSQPVITPDTRLPDLEVSHFLRFTVVYNAVGEGRKDKDGNEEVWVGDDLFEVERMGDTKMTMNAAIISESSTLSESHTPEREDPEAEIKA
ncbi:hypothetical protein HK097_004837 [Rhizophlyctis rosea]|uniref:Uncharacterized protein n=1 Tax=Rhizophlyctis rosea TaxID=64517 RepID=A0AAD5S2F1_9FUNG|nr:hypothetical protein HK097_004837 [Rhizophlyctis rosea]